MSPSRSLLCSRTVYPTVIITSHFAHHKDTPVLIYLQPMSCLFPSNLVLLCCSLFFIPVNGITSIQFCNPNPGVIFVIFLSFITHFQSITLSCQGYLTPHISPICLLLTISITSIVTCITTIHLCLEYCHSF